MPVMDGLTATRAIIDEFPDAKVIVLTTYGGDEDIHRALDAGAMGYLVKDMVAGEILNIIRTVHAGRRGIPQPIAAKLAEHTPRIALTPRETEVLSLVATASAMGRSPAGSGGPKAPSRSTSRTSFRSSAPTTGPRR